jgi:addiction module HigA family antidote
MQMHNPPHPGKMLNQLYLKEYNLSIAKAALLLGLSRKHLSNIVNAKVPITPEVALRIGKCFNVDPDLWMRFQTAYNMWQAKQHVDLSNIQVIAM